MTLIIAAVVFICGLLVLLQVGQLFVVAGVGLLVAGVGLALLGRGDL